jgi:hypothetical protein
MGLLGRSLFRGWFDCRPKATTAEVGLALWVGGTNKSEGGGGVKYSFINNIPTDVHLKYEIKNKFQPKMRLMETQIG